MENIYNNNNLYARHFPTLNNGKINDQKGMYIYITPIYICMCIYVFVLTYTVRREQ